MWGYSPLARSQLQKGFCPGLDLKKQESENKQEKTI